MFGLGPLPGQVVGIAQAVLHQHRARLDQHGQTVIGFGQREVVAQVGEYAKGVVDLERRLAVHLERGHVGRAIALLVTQAPLIQRHRLEQQRPRGLVITFGQLQHAHLRQGVEIVRRVRQHIAEGHLGELSITALAVNAPDPDQSLVAFRLQFDGAQILIQRLIQVAGLVGHRGHLHGLIGRTGLFAYLVQQRIVAAINRAGIEFRLRPHGLTS
ncbi:hypothetical protein D3C84_531460 [compost metagenome]